MGSFGEYGFFVVTHGRGNSDEAIEGDRGGSVKRRTEGISTTKAQRHKEEMAEATEGRGKERWREGA